MIDSLKQLQGRIAVLHSSLRKLRTKQLSRTDIKDELRSCVHDYFAEFRPQFIAIAQRKIDLTSLDALMQDLLRAVQRRGLVSIYLNVIRAIKENLHELELILVTSRSDSGAEPSGDLKHGLILKTLAKVCPPAATSFAQGLSDLNEQIRKSWRGTTVEFREALREVLDVMAPDEAVSSQPGFKLEPDTHGPTMRQKATFILRSRRLAKNQVKAAVDAIDVTEGLVGKFVRSVYDRSSFGAHGNVSRDEAIRVRDYVTLVLTELLEIRI